MHNTTPERLPLPINHPDTKAALRLYSDRFDQHHRSVLSIRDIFFYFCFGEDIVRIAARTGMSYSWIRMIYEQVFQEKVFGGLSYADYRWYRLAESLGLAFPATGILDLVAKTAREQGYEVATITKEYGRTYTRTRALLLNDVVCPVHCFYGKEHVRADHLRPYPRIAAVGLNADGVYVSFIETTQLLKARTSSVTLHVKPRLHAHKAALAA